MAHKKDRKSSRRTYYKRRAHITTHKAGIFSLIKKVAPVVAFSDLISAKGRASGKYNGTMIQNAQTFINNITGNIAGFNLLPGGQKFTAQRNVNAIFNQYTYMGIASIVGSAILKKTGLKIPMAQKIFSIGKPLAVAGAVGGFFDDVGMQQSYRQTNSIAVNNYSGTNWSVPSS